MTSHDAVQLERAARERAERRLARIAAIQRVIDDAGSKPDLEPLLQALVEELREALSSDTATILLTDETGTELLRRTSSGVEGRLAEPARVPMGRGIAGRVAASKAPLILPDISKHEVVSTTLRETLTSIAAVPMIAHGRVVGVVHVGSLERHEFSHDDVLLLRLVADRAASAIAAMQSAVRDRESERLAFIARAAMVFSGSLDLEATIAGVLDVTIPTLGDFGFVDIVVEDGVVRRIARAHRDPRRQALLEGTSWTRSTRTDVNLCALSTGQAAVHPVVDDAWLESVATSREHLSAMRELSFGSMLTVPLIARTKTLGALTLFRATSHPSYDDESLQLASAIASPAALAIDNAYLFEEAQRSVRRKDEFFAVLGHELRNPLAPIVTSLDLLRRRIPAAPELDVMERQVAHLVRLVDDLLDVTRITRGKVELHPSSIEIADVVDAAVEQIAPLLEKRGHTFSTSVPSTGLRCQVDPQRVAQILSNLLSNAAKYTPRGGNVSLQATREGAEVVIVVADDGPGIPADMMATLFDPFSQGPQGIDRAGGGLGLGLAIARSLAQLHHGTLTAHSDGPNEGSRFELRLPRMSTGTELEAADDEPVDAASPSRRILVVDDNRDAAQMLAVLLDTQGHEVRVAHDGPGALQIAADFGPELALLDIGLPVMDGYELARRMRATVDPPPRMIAITGYGDEGDRERSAAAGFEHHLVKPVSLANLKRVLGTPKRD